MHHSTAWTLEIGTISSELQFTKQTRQVPSFQLSLQLGTHMYWLHSPNPQVPSCIICFLARNSASLPASMLCSDHCFFACFYARNIASLPASVLGTLLPSMYARNPAFLPDPSALCLYLCSARNSASFNALLGTLLLCMFRASDYPCSLDY